MIKMVFLVSVASFVHYVRFAFSMVLHPVLEQAIYLIASNEYAI